MPRKPRFNLPGVPQHVVQRGNNREPCFLLGEIVKIGRLNFYTLGTRRRTTEYTLRGFA